jgi:hypothetical protein
MKGHRLAGNAGDLKDSERKKMAICSGNIGAEENVA